MAQPTYPTYSTTKKTFFYNFFPAKDNEEASAARAISNVSHIPRVLVEMRDVRPPPMFNPQNPWIIRKTLTQYEIENGRLVVSWNDTFEYIIRYWNLSMANHIAFYRHKISVILWDLTDGSNPKKYEGNAVYFQITQNDLYVLTCHNMMLDRNLRVDDYIGLYWNVQQNNFCFKVFYKSTK